MNRQWAAMFGQGIVKTVEDFGYQGEAPTHPELLDWLAVELVRRGWSLKPMHKLIVTSATYQQSSVVDAGTCGPRSAESCCLPAGHGSASRPKWCAIWR